jgi:hypothetical protein
MNRHDRRKAKAIGRKMEVATMVCATTINVVLVTGERVLYWIAIPQGMSNEKAAATQEWHGPFRTDAEVAEDQRITLLGEQCKVTEAPGDEATGRHFEQLIQLYASRLAPWGACRDARRGRPRHRRECVGLRNGPSRTCASALGAASLLF